MSRTTAGGEGLLAAFASCVAHLAAHADEVNALNVFPVPDGDTGSNMLATVRAALSEAQAVPADDRSVQRIASAISFGALMGARGNSGVILSQVFRGMAEGLGGKQRFDGVDLAHGLERGRDAAYAAVVKPVEGTILTVISDAAAAAVEAAGQRPDLESTLTAAVTAARDAVDRTPTLLPVLREAGVVDAGGQGLYLVLEGGLLHILGRSAAVGRPVAESAAVVHPAVPAAHGDEGFGYETMYLLQATGTPLDPVAIRDHLESIGSSVLVAGDARAVKVHVHNERPDLVIGYGLRLGGLSRVVVENLDDQARDVRETRARDFAAGVETPSGGGTAGGAAVAVVEAAAPARARSRRPVPALSIVAATTGDGLARIFESFGVECVVRGGQTANPSTGELVAAIHQTEAKDVLVLANNANVELAAEQAADLADHGKHVVVVPTRNALEGFAALLVLDPQLGATENREVMLDAARAIQTIQVTAAARDARIGDKKVKKGHAIALGPDDGLLAVHKDRLHAALAAIGRLQPGFELVTLYHGEGADRAEAEALARRVRETYPSVEVEVQHGGQPHYSYLISAE